MKMKDIEIAPLIKAYILIDQINSEKNINNSLFELKKMSKIYGDEFIKNVNLISFNHINFKNMNIQKENESFFILNFPEFIENEHFSQIFPNLLMDANKNYSVSDIFNVLNIKIKLKIEQQIKLIISFIDSGIKKYIEEGNSLFLGKCKEIFELKLFSEFNNNIIVEKIINILFNILKIKNRQDNDNKTENEIDIDETDIQLYIQSFSHCNEQLKNKLLNKEINLDNLEMMKKLKMISILILAPIQNVK